MFRSIQKTLKVREQDISQLTKRNQEIDKIISDFLKQSFGQNISQIKIETSFEKGVLKINTDNKILANEIILQSGSLCRLLQNKQINCRQIVIY